MSLPSVQNRMETSKSWWERREKSVSRGVSTSFPITIVKAQNATLWDEKGQAYIDFAGGIGCMNVGHSHPRVVAAIQRQAADLCHTCFHVAMNRPHIELAEALIDVAPIQGEKRVFFASTGAEAVENAIKIAKAYTGRSAVLTFEAAFHGRTLLAMSLTSKISPYKNHFGPFAPEIYRLPYADPYHNPEGLTGDALVEEKLRQIRHAFATVVDPKTVAAMIVEPVQGEGGFIIPPKGFLPGLRDLCREHGIVFIVDEVQSGFGRTGKLFTCMYEDIDPDLLLMAKSLSAGMPLSAVVGREKIMNAVQPGGLGGTFAGNPVSAVAALEVIKIMEEEKLPERAIHLGQIGKQFFENLQQQYPLIGDVRGLGAMLAVELVKDRTTREPDAKAASFIIQRSFAKGLILLKAGIADNVLRLLMPLTIPEEQYRKGLSIIAECIAEYMQEN